MANQITGHLYLFLDYVNPNQQGTQVAYYDLNTVTPPLTGSLSTTNIALGSHTLTAFYTAGNFPDLTTPPIPITINADQSGVNIVVSANPSTQTQGQPIAITISMTIV